MFIRIFVSKHPLKSVEDGGRQDYSWFMKKFILLSFAITICIFTEAFSEVYRSVSKEGNVTYSDVPDINSEKLDLPELSTYKPISKKETKKYTAEQSAQKEDQTSSVSYTGLKILSPSNNDSIRGNAGNVPVQLLVSPNLKIKLGHRFILSIDGKQVASTTVSRYKLTNIERGSHTLTVQIINKNNKALTRAVSVSFHMIISAEELKKIPETGYTPDYKPSYKPKASPGYKPKPSPGYKP